MRRVLIFLALVALVAAASPSAVGAHRSIRFTEDSTFMYCDAVANEHGMISLGVESRNGQPAFGWLGFQSAGAEVTWISRDAEVAFAADGGSFTAAFSLYEYLPETDELGDHVGDATAQVTLSPAGEPEPVDYRSSRSNHRVRVEGKVQQLTASGSVDLPGGRTFELAGCQAHHELLSVRANSPDSYVASTSGVSVNCAWETDSYAVHLGGWQEIGFTGVDIWVADASGESFGGTDDALLSESAMQSTFDLHDASDEGAAVGSVSVSATMSRTGERFRFVDRFGFERYVFSGVRLDVSGTVTVSRDGLPDLHLAMNRESCSAEKFRSSYRVATPNGTPQRGRPLANDDPADAIALEIGSAVRLRSTAGSDAAAEAPCVLDAGDESFEVPLGHTGWWSFVGTGGEVTVDTAGSTFDTVVGAYVADGADLAQVGCADDVEDGLQAAITIQADAGVTYLVQVGGYAGTSGRLELVIR